MTEDTDGRAAGAFAGADDRADIEGRIHVDERAISATFARKTQPGMRCPECGTKLDSVSKTEPGPDNTIRRRRVCPNAACGTVCRTSEYIEKTTVKRARPTRMEEGT